MCSMRRGGGLYSLHGGSAGTWVVFSLVLTAIVSCSEDGKNGQTTDGGADSGHADDDSGTDSEGSFSATITGPDGQSALEEGDQVTFTGEATNGVPPYQYSWSFGGCHEDASGADTGPLVLDPGECSIIFEVVDSTGDSAQDEMVVTVATLEGQMKLWYGNLHSHTDYSDGEGTPSDAFEFARDQAGLDFYVVTDHSEMLFGSEWGDILDEADLYEEPGVFATMRGFEWSHPVNGHMCIYNTDDRTAAYTSIWITYIYDWVDARGALAQFNHPGREIGVFGNLALDGSVVDNMFAIETGNKGDGINDGEFLPYYVQALDNGWHVAPTSNQDNHSLSINSHRSVYLGPDISRTDLLAAMDARRFYSSDDPDIEIYFKAGGQWMGSVLYSPGDEVVFKIKIADDEPIVDLRLVTNQGATAASLVPQEAATEVFWTPTVPVTPGNYFYVEVTSEDLLDGDGPNQIAVTAPIWIQ